MDLELLRITMLLGRGGSSFGGSGSRTMAAWFASGVGTDTVWPGNQWDVEADLKSGSLVELLQEFSAGSTGLQIVNPATQEQPKRVRLLIERIAEAFSSSGP
jgi:DNA-binding transcriptional LysR family regulator